MDEYVKRSLSSKDLEDELKHLISEYNRIRGTYLFLYSTAMQKQLKEASLDQDDYYIISDMLSHKRNTERLDFYVETPGGSGVAAEEIVRFLHNSFQHISFVVCGEAKSAGTILVLSGHDILMTDTGSLGPIDAQMVIGRSQISAWDYTDWVETKRAEAQNTQTLNPFDAIMVAQISPGELQGVNHALNFASDLVVEWLRQYKFGNWTTTETRNIPVTEDMKLRRAEEVAHVLCNHSRWRSHGRSIKIADLHEIGLKIDRIDDDPSLADIVYRIKAVCWMLFNSSTAYKIFASADSRIFKHAAPANSPPIPNNINVKDVKAVEINQQCPKCGTLHKIYCKLDNDPNIDADFHAKGCIPYPKDDKIICSCGFEIDLSGAKNQVELQIGKKVIK